MIPIPPPAPNRIAIASALRRASPGNSRAVSTPAVEKDIAPNTPAAIRQKVCQPIVASYPVASSVSVVVTMPNPNNRAGAMRPISSSVSTAPMI